MNPKTAAREYALQFLFYNKDIHSKEDLEKRLEEFANSYNEPDREQPNQPLAPEEYNFALFLIEGVLDNYTDLIASIEKTLIKNKSLASIENIDLKILLVAFFEHHYVKTTPRNVIINEAINIAKKYSTKDSYLFINGLLDKLK